MPNHLNIPDEIFNDLPPQFRDPELDLEAPGPFGGTMGDALQQAVTNRFQEMAKAQAAGQAQDAAGMLPGPGGPLPEGVPEGSQFVASGAGLRQQMNQTVTACAKEVNRVLQFHGCVMQAEPYVTPDGRIDARIAIKVALGPQDPPGPPQPPR